LPSIPIASSFLAGSLLSLLLPILLLIGLVIWYAKTIRNVPKEAPPTEVAPITTEASDSGPTTG
jgi:hypothetical protein